ncbi:hypothetical protein, partial [Shimazuella kribbensis]|uniref:hypothetical protein n=1 Tax=Shimazuella kribbensis TaxID=139808 RepID=UPI001B7FDA87
ESHPIWVRGLKYQTPYISHVGERSHPIWMSGLKCFLYEEYVSYDKSLILALGKYFYLNTGLK